MAGRTAAQTPGEPFKKIMDAVLDTSILLDLMLSYPPSVSWIHQQESRIFAVSTVTMMEIVEGSTNQQDMRRKLKFLKQFSSLSLIQSDFDWAFKQFTKFYLSYHTGWEDCIIAAPCERLQLILYTRNLKHFRPRLGNLAVAPY